MTHAYLLDYTVHAEDAEAARGAFSGTPQTGWGRSLALAGSLALLFGAAALWERLPRSAVLAAAVLVVVALGLLVRALPPSSMSSRRSALRPHGIVTGPCRLAVHEDLITWRHADQTIAIRGDAIRGVAQGPLGPVIEGRRGPLLWIPTSAFYEACPEQDLQEAIARAQQVGFARDAHGAGAPDGFWRGYLRNLRSGFGAALLWPIDRAPLDARPIQWIALAATLIGTACLVQHESVGPAAEFNLAGVAGLLFLLPVLLLASSCAAAIAGASVRMADLSILALAAALYTEPASRLLVGLQPVANALGRLVADDALVPTLNAIWLGLVLAAGVLWRTRPKPPRALGALLCALLIVAVTLSLVPYDDALWVPPLDGGDAASAPASDDQLAADEVDADQVSEARMYREASVLNRALARLAPARRDRINLYLVGFAGTSTQDVFMKEVHSVGSLFAERFQTANRSVLLINNPATLDAEPIATGTALASALARIGQLMDPERDLLFLYMTSHGGPDHSFSVSFPPLLLSDIHPLELRRMLDDAGIRNRVIVVSACYSGGFIDALKDDFSVVMTAAAADRTSFGCSNEEDYTYFGRAYIDEGLRASTSFVDAFRLAEPRIAQREAEQGFKPSEPQLFVGARIGPVLQRFQNQLPAGGALAAARVPRERATP